MRRSALLLLLPPLAATPAVPLGAQELPPLEKWIAPEGARARPNPVPEGEAALSRGRALFKGHCARCHGDRGDGNGPAAVDLRDPELQARLTDGEIFWKISTGRRDGDEEVMPPLARKVKSERDRWKVVRFVRYLATTWSEE